MMMCGLLVISFFVCGAIAIMSTRSPLPLGDAFLTKADHIIGVSARDIVLRLAAAPPFVIEALVNAYHSTGPLIFVTIIVLPWMQRTGEAWRFTALLCITLLACSVIAFLLPAYGIFLSIDQSSIPALPPSAGRYFWQHLSSFRNASDPLVSVEAIGGVVSFPSFHTILALLLTQAWASIRFVSKPACLFASTVIVSSIPMGGHYFADLIAGFVIWLGCSLLVDRAVQRPKYSSQPIKDDVSESCLFEGCTRRQPGSAIWTPPWWRRRREGLPMMAKASKFEIASHVDCPVSG